MLCTLIPFYSQKQATANFYESPRTTVSSKKSPSIGWAYVNLKQNFRVLDPFKCTVYIQ